MSDFEDTSFRGGFAGGCLRQGQDACVAEPEPFCDAGTWKSAHWLRSNPGHALRYCAGQLASVPIGRCGDSGWCANLAVRCDDPSSFVPYDPTCTITQDLAAPGPNMTFTTYGKCGDRCVWSPQDCLTGEDYVKNDPACTADQTKIGSCFAGHAFCAVSAAACDGEPWLSHEQTAQEIGVNCFLAALPAEPSPTPAPALVVPSVPSTTTTTPTGSTGAPQNSTTRMFDQSSVMIGVVVGIAVVFGLAVGVAGFFLGVRRRSQKDKEDANVPKCLDLSQTQDGGGGSKMEVADDDDISAL